MRRILVTGATSMIGAALIKKLIENGDKVVAIVRENCTKLSKLPNSQQIEVVSCNMDEYWKLTDKIEGTIDVALLQHGMELGEVLEMTMDFRLIT